MVIIFQSFIVTHVKIGAFGGTRSIECYIRFISKNTFDQRTEPFAQTLKIAFVGKFNKAVDRRRIHYIYIGIIIFDFHLDFAAGFGGANKTRRKVAVFGWNGIGTAAAWPVEFIVEPDGFEAELFSFFANSFHRGKIFFGKILKFASASGIDHILFDTGLTVTSQDLDNIFARRFSGNSSHHDQRIDGSHKLYSCKNIVFSFYIR